MKKGIIASFVVFLLVSCVTVNIYFPAAAIQRAADAIVEEVRGDGKVKEQPPAKDKGSSLTDRFIVIQWGAAEVHAQSIDVEVSTPAIRALKESMRQRFERLKTFYDRGALGEGNDGLVAMRDSGGLNLKDKADLSRLAEAENKDRRDLYAEIMKANRFGPEVLPQIQKIFANSWRDNAQRGWWIQRDGGEWVKKP